ncbi:hypothetical protein ACF3MZ_17380 [Paenibacillaceae bacterium WGS1546]|uniref:hypothetical protein n=1 Tax=Cohnella sp. WGS1546 TaxID=3366810 RepID=UPI00372D68D4
MAGIHLHPHDIIDEGPGRILELIGRMGKVEYLFPEVNTIFERNPYPSGRLPHNPVREFVQGYGTLHVRVNPESVYAPLRQKVDETMRSGDSDPLARIKEAVEGTDYRTIPWVNLLNGHFEGDLASNGVVDFRGRPVEHWLCPNGPDVVPIWSAMLAEMTKRYGYETYLIDRIRYPDWAGLEVRPSGIFSCFCPNCVDKMAAEGIATIRLLEEMQQVASLLREQSFKKAVELMGQSNRIRQWVRFRQDSVSAFVERLAAATSALNPSIRLWLDLWPPSYSWLLGQDYGRLTRTSDTLKHFPYHKLGGGADVQGFIDYFARTSEQREEAFRAFLKFFNLDYDLSYSTFRQKGYPIEFVRNENDKARTLSAPGTKIFSGVQMWNLSPDDLKLAVLAARASEADDVLYYCYGWADEELFDAVGVSGGGQHNRIR